MRRRCATVDVDHVYDGFECLLALPHLPDVCQPVDVVAAAAVTRNVAWTEQ